MGVSVQGAAAESLTTARNQFSPHTWRTCVCDQGLGILLDDLGGSDANVVLDAITVREPPLLKFDFGTASSPVAEGYLQATNATGYTASRGYGWLSGAVAARDRGSYGQLLRDFNFSADATFVTDVLPGRYLVTYTMGDAAAGHDQMGLYLEGELLPSVTVAAGQFATNVWSVVVTDGQLTVRLTDRGGSDPNAVINRLEIR
jgi:fibronectin type 3 domain-containing protein